MTTLEAILTLALAASWCVTAFFIYWERQWRKLAEHGAKVATEAADQCYKWQEWFEQLRDDTLARGPDGKFRKRQG